MGTYPFLLNEPFELVKNCLGEIDNNNFYQSFNESVYEEIPDTPEELLLPIEDSAKREIWIERGGPEACVLSTLIHELTHAWQAEHVNMDKLGIQIIEGHSTFVEIECLRKLGQSIYADFWEKTVLNRNDDYSKGLQYWKSLMQSESDKNIFVILSAAIIAAGVLFIVFKLNHKDNEPSSKIYFDYPQSENVVTDKKSGEQYVNNEILISAAKEAKYSDIENLVKEYDGTIIGYIEKFGEYQVRINSTYSREELLNIADKLTESKFVDSTSLNYAMNISDSGYFIPNDSWGGNQNWDSKAPEGNNWGVEAINAPQAWDHRDEMSKITIGLIDGGFEDHEDLTFAWTQSSTTSDHGCHVAGIMAADFNNSTGISGVMPNQKSNGDSLVDLIGIKENGDEFNEMFTFEFKSAFAELLIRHAKVINVSQGFNWYMGTKNGWDESYWNNNNITAKAENLANTYAGALSTFLSRCIKRNYDFVIVCAAGNDDGVNARYSSPLTAITDTEVVSHIIVVGAIQNEGREFSIFGNGKHKGYSVAAFSNLGERVDIMAPGKEIYSCISENKYDSYNGTSMASPMLQE